MARLRDCLPPREAKCRPHLRKVESFPCGPGIGALDQQRPEVDIASLGDAEWRVVVPGLAASRPQAEITAHIATSLEVFLAAQCQDIGQRRELADAIDFDQRMRLRVLRLCQLLDQTVISRSSGCNVQRWFLGFRARAGEQFLEGPHLAADLSGSACCGTALDP
jgi:hypothetical protein